MIAWDLHWSVYPLGGLLAVALAATWLIYLRTAALPVRERLALALLRSLAVIAAALLLLRPEWIHDAVRQVRPEVIVLVDDSASMDIRDVGTQQSGGTGRRSRAAVAHELIAGPVLADLARQADLRCYRFDSGLEAITPGAPRTADDLDRPERQATRCGDALAEAVARSSGATVAGVVLFSDGASNDGRDPLAVAERLGRRGIPIYPVGLGQSDPDDVAVHHMVVQDVVFAGDRVPVRVQLSSRGFENRTAMLRVLRDGVEVAAQQLVLAGGQQQARIEFTAPESAGSGELTVAVEPLPNEASADNNAVQRSVRVADQRLRVLCVEGSPRWEFRYLRAILKRDPRLEVRFVTTEGDAELASRAKDHLAQIPDDPDQLFAYDLVILGDVRLGALSPVQLDLVHDLVRNQGGALIALAGPKHLPAAYLDTPIAAMLPVWPAAGVWEPIDDAAYPALTPAGESSTIMQLIEADDRNRALWASIRPLSRLPPLGGAKPGAQVLAEVAAAGRAGAAAPLIAWHRYGQGKVLFVGTDRLFRLREGVGDVYHARFWSQAIQFLALSRLMGENARLRYAVTGAGRVGMPMTIHLHASDEQYAPMTVAQQGVRITRVDDDRAQELPMLPVPGRPGVYQAAYVPDAPGRYRVGAPEGVAGAHPVECTITAGSAEPAVVAMQQGQLARIAELSGGRLLAVEDLPRLPTLITATPRAETQAQRLRLFDHWLWLLPLVGLLLAEWTWRRLRDLA
jgi:hypothetical protein